MASTGSVLKRLRQSIKANARNKHYKSQMKTAIKSALSSTDKTEVQELTKNAVSTIDKVLNRGIIHKNSAGRQKSRLNKAIKLIS